ncbi:sugar transferase [Listeria booriae]|uniref:Sugar transferase n=2 Tax=Listeria booriae TaxID=1552123 RepID=A0A7X0Z8K3_9LIST|nr:sugar transferase [Listeria booriae]MBC1234898.1 sugar transferase [Listeria booriae]MBC1247911.1 sugar transferase [Listeria booriae]MBC1563714.1 sugar transferase [Listeria booriae]MBC2100217.1 sugar transferase [Listeria booriae]
MAIILKRLLDIILSIIGIIIALPIMLVVMLCIKWEDKGPALFIQTRTGKDDRPFSIYKFRSMKVRNEEALKEEHVYEWEDGVPDTFVFKDVGETNPNVTKVGAFIRRTSLDELPQLFNVFIGNMSFIGPRPEIPAITSRYSAQQKKRLDVKPGITGWAQVNGRSSVTNGEKMKMDYYYIENYSLRLDIIILIRTVKVVLTSRGAV